MANNHKLRRFRKVAARRQQHRCHYCDAPMWWRRPEVFAERHGLRVEDCVHFQCTAEHWWRGAMGVSSIGTSSRLVGIATLRGTRLTFPCGGGVSERVRSDAAWLTRRLLAR
jgi:hypothetical protein